MERTTISLSPATRDRLLDLKRAWNAESTEDVVIRLLEGEATGAKALYLRHKTAVDKVLARYNIRRLVAFGSRARGDARPDSDLDLVGDLPKKASLLDLVHVKDELQDVLGLEVDFLAFTGLTPRLRRQVEREGVNLVG